MPIKEITLKRKLVKGGGVVDYCSDCKYSDYFHVHMKFCPGCGGKIKHDERNSNK